MVPARFSVAGSRADNPGDNDQDYHQVQDAKKDS
jgi:hypothetical protein